MAIGVDKVQLTKLESTALGGEDLDIGPYNSPQPINAQEDAIEIAGIYFNDEADRDDAVRMFRDQGEMWFRDTVTTVAVSLSALAAKGDVTGPGSSEDNAVARFNGTTGKFVQGSSVTIDDSGNMLLEANGSSTISPRVLGARNFSSGEAIRWEFGDYSNAIQNAWGGSMTLGSYHTLILRGDRDTSGGLAFETVSDIGVWVPNTVASSPALVVDGAPSQSAALQQWRDSAAAVLASIDAGGNIVFAGTQTVDGRDVSADGSTLDSHVSNTGNPHSTDIGNIGSGTLAELNTAITDATLDDSGSSRTPTSHNTSHQNGGADAISIAGLAGEAAGKQKVAIEKSGVAVGTRSTLNFIEGTGVTLTMEDDSAGDEVDITVAASGGGASSPLTTKGDVWGYSTTDARIPVGTNGQVLTVDSAEGPGVTWANPANSLWLQAGNLASVSGTIGLMYKTPVTGENDVTSTSGQPLTTQHDQMNNSTLDPFLIPLDGVIHKASIYFTAGAVGDGTVGASPQIRIAFYKVNADGTGRTLLGNRDLDVQTTGLGVWNNLGTPSPQVDQQDITDISVSAGDMVGWEFQNVSGDSNMINAVRNLFVAICYVAD